MPDDTTTDDTTDDTTTEEEQTTDPPEEDGDTFDRAYVERLRDESARYRQRAGTADTLAAALWAERVTATGRLADPTDLPMPTDADPLDGDALTAAVDDLLTRKPHLASRRPTGDVGQGASGQADTVDLAGILRAGAM